MGFRFWNLEMFDPSIQPSVTTAGIEKSYYVNIYILVNQEHIELCADNNYYNASQRVISV